MKAYLTLQNGHRKLGTLHLELYDETVPKTVENFVQLLSGGYRGCPFHRIINGFMAQCGDTTNGDGTGGTSIYGNSFDDENFLHNHNQAGTLSMANSGPNTNGSQFFITFRATPHLDGRHVVFGHVDLTHGPSNDVLEALERVPTGPNDRPKQPVTILDCGLLVQADMKQLAVDREKTVVAPAVAPDDDDEIDLDEADEEEIETKDANPADDEGEKPKTKAQALKLRLRKLKQKMNQARQLNKQAVKEEGEHLATDPDKTRKRLNAHAKKTQLAVWEAANAKAIHLAKTAGVDPKAVTEQAADSVYKAHARAERDERGDARDHYNPDGQHRNYERNLRSLPKHRDGGGGEGADAADTATYNPLEEYNNTTDSTDGARRVASELHRRYERAQKKDLKRKERELRKGGEEATGINQRNKRFVEKISRTYDQQTAEIRHNLERGTAL
jgi:cyclophilin family peptidyl-prolyl cis-trans isomerase